MKHLFFKEDSEVQKAQIADYWELTKPRLVLLVILSTFIGFYLGNVGPVQWAVLFPMLLGASIVAASSMVLNQWLERDSDALMTRTEKRPIPSGRVEPMEALGFGLILAILGIAILEIAVNTMSSFIAVLTLLSYLFVYTPLKQKTDWSTVVGAFPGALPPLIGWASVNSVMTLEAFVIFSIMFFWQMPHFFAISWIYREDYARANICVLSVTHPDGRYIAKQSLFYTLPLIPISLLPTFLGMTGMLYFFGAILLGAVLLGAAIFSFREADRGTKVLFRTSVVYLSLLFILMIVDKVS